MAEAAFSEDGKYYSAISSDGRLKIWDTETSVLKQEYTPDLHLTAPPSCIQWITVTQVVGKGNKRGSVSESESQCVALGTANGKILIYSVAQAKVEAVLQKGGNKINALDWHRKYGLYSCAKETVVEWDLQTGRVKNLYNVGVFNKSKQGNYISAIKIVPHNLPFKARYLVTASWQVRLWRLHDGDAEVIKTLGHNASQTAVLSIATLMNNCWLMEGSQNERLLSFWDVTITEEHLPLINGEETTPSKKKRKKSLTDVPTIINASYNFVLEDAPRMVDVELSKEDDAIRLNLAAATRSGVVHYYGHMLNGSSVKPLKPSVTLQVTTAEATPLALQCCRLRGSDILVGYSDPPAMVFETVVPDLKTKTQVLIRGETKTPRRAKQTNETNKVRSDNKSSEAQVVEPMGGVSISTRKRAAPGAQIEVPMEARLANLSLDVREHSETAVNQNLTRLLIQGLHSKDASILNMVLKNKPAVAKRTVGNLPAEYVPQLLEHLVQLATMKTQSCMAACTWLSALTSRHSALLLALMGSHNADQLARLLAVFTHRRSHLCQLMNLKGRVELTINQRTASEESQEDQKAILEYNDDTSSEDEMQVEKYKSDSEESWGDNKFDSDQDNEDDDDEVDQDDKSSSGEDND